MSVWDKSAELPPVGSVLAKAKIDAKIRIKMSQVFTDVPQGIFSSFLGFDFVPCLYFKNY